MYVFRRRFDLFVKWLVILVVGLGGRVGGCLRRDSCFIGVFLWFLEKVVGFFGGRSRIGLVEGFWDRRILDLLVEGFFLDIEGIII